MTAVFERATLYQAHDLNNPPPPAQLLAEVLEVIETLEREPQLFPQFQWNQGTWGSPLTDYEIEKHFEKHNISLIEWGLGDQDKRAEIASCGAAFCFAGWANVVGGGEPPGNFDYEHAVATPEEMADPSLTTYTIEWAEPSGEVKSAQCVDVSERARRLLGLSNDQANVLFEADNSLPQLRAYVEALIADPAVDLYDVTPEPCEDCGRTSCECF